MSEHEQPPCDDCDTEMLLVDGEYHCPACNSLSGFTLVPDEEEFAL